MSEFQPEQDQMQGPYPGDVVEAADGQRNGMLAEALGMHPDFVRDVSRRGMMAIIDRVEETDPYGAKGKLLRIVQQFGTWYEQRMQFGAQPSSDEMRSAASMSGEQMQVDPEIAWTTVYNVLQKYGEMAQTLGSGGR